MSKVKVGYMVDEQIAKVFKEMCDSKRATGPAVIEACMKGYASGVIKMLDGEIFVSALAQPSLVPRETPPPQAMEVPKRHPGRPPKNPISIPDWYEMDHSERELKDFDFPDNIHPHADPRPYLELETAGTKYDQSYKAMLYAEYDGERAKYSEVRMWDLEYWNFCRWVAKKFFTLNRILDLRYDENYLQKELHELKEIAESFYQRNTKAQAFREKHGRFPTLEELENELQ